MHAAQGTLCQRLRDAFEIATRVGSPAARPASMCQWLRDAFEIATPSTRQVTAPRAVCQWLRDAFEIATGIRGLHVGQQPPVSMASRRLRERDK